MWAVFQIRRIIWKSISGSLRTFYTPSENWRFILQKEHSGRQCSRQREAGHSTAGCWEGWGPALSLKSVLRTMEVKAVPPGGTLRDCLLENLTQVWQTKLKATKWNLRWATTRIPQGKAEPGCPPEKPSHLQQESFDMVFFILYGVCNSLLGFWGKAPIRMLGIKIYQKKCQLRISKYINRWGCKVVINIFKDTRNDTESVNQILDTVSRWWLGLWGKW